MEKSVEFVRHLLVQVVCKIYSKWLIRLYLKHVEQLQVQVDWVIISFNWNFSFQWKSRIKFAAFSRLSEINISKHYFVFRQISSVIASSTTGKYKSFSSPTTGSSVKSSTLKNCLGRHAKQFQKWNLEIKIIAHFSSFTS